MNSPGIILFTCLGFIWNVNVHSSPPFITPPTVTPDWYALGPGIDGTILTIAIAGNDVYVGGSFLDAGGVPEADYLARWDGCEWHAVSGGLNGIVNEIEINGPNIYIAGEFTTPVTHIGFWDGAQWNSFGNGVNAPVKAIELSGTEVYVAGDFTDAGNNSNADYVALWNGTSWENLDLAINNSVNDMEWNGEDLYILGDFTDAGGNYEADYIARWDGAIWNNVGTTIQEFPPFTFFGSLELYGNDVWIGGNFGIAGNQQMVCLARWDGFAWSPHFGSTIMALNIIGNFLYASNGATDCAYLLTRNLISNEWGTLPGCLETHVYVFASNGADIFAGGYFWATPPYSGCPACNIMRYGAPDQILIITGVPSELCQTHPPILLPPDQSGFIGTWSGPGVINNIFDPLDLMGDITITFTPEDGGCFDSVDFNISVSNCYTPPPIDWIWAKAISGDNSREGLGVPEVYDITTDTANAVYTTGYFYGSVDFNPGAAEFFMSPVDATDGFVCKLNEEGQFVWAKQIGGEGSGVIGYSITTDDAGGVYITGEFSNYVDFDPGPQTHFLYSAGESDIFILKLNYNGQFQWVKTFGGTLGTCWGTSIKIEASTGSIYTTGTHSGSIDFDPGTGGYFLGNNDHEYNIFISKLDSLGNFIWAREVQGPTAFSVTTGTSIAVDPVNGNVYVAGHFYGTCDFDPYNNGYDLMTSNGNADIFILKLDSNGNHIWAHQLGGNAIDYCPSIALGSPGNEKVYISGGYSETVDFDPGPDVFNLTSAYDLFICKLDSAGNFIWAKSLGGASGIPFYSGSFLCVDTLRHETVSTAGGFVGTADFDPGPDTFLLTSNGATDIFICKIDSSGNFIWAKTAGGSTNDFSVSLAIDEEGKFLTTGNYDSPTLLFDATTLTNVSDPNVFVAKAGGCTTIVTNTSNSGAGSLRDVIQCAQSGDLVTFSLAPQSEITLTTGEILINKDLSLLGPGISNLTISGNNASRIFNLTLDTDFYVENLALKDATAITNGGSILTKGNLTLRNVLIQHNFQNGIPKGLTLSHPGQMLIKGIVDIKY